MNYEKACENLGIESYKEHDSIDEETIKHRYRINALKYHPDKNASIDASAKFQEIKESYDYLMKYEGFIDDEEDSDEVYHTGGYIHLLIEFLKKILNIDGCDTRVIHIILQKIFASCETTALETIHLLDKTILIKIYDVLLLYAGFLHLPEDFTEKLKKIISEKTANDECIVLNPIIEDLFENNLYKMTMNGGHYIIPLWHKELVYDNSGSDIYVRCKPILPKNMQLDSANNILIEVEYNIREIWGKDTLKVELYNRMFYINIEWLHLRKTQIIVFYNQGISCINTNNIYDISKKSNVYIYVTLTI
jgi:hypothetical protein